MNTSRTVGLLTLLSAARPALTGCGAGGGHGSGTTASTAAAGHASGSGTTAAALRTASTSLGTVVVDSAGNTVYALDKDTKGSGTSACTGGCAGLWPAVTTTAVSPTAAGVSAKLGTIPRPDGTRQITLDGRPLYTYSRDSGAGAVSGQGVKGIWWAVPPGGAEITAAPAPAGY